MKHLIFSENLDANDILRIEVLSTINHCLWNHAGLVLLKLPEEHDKVFLRTIVVNTCELISLIEEVCIIRPDLTIFQAKKEPDSDNYVGSHTMPASSSYSGNTIAEGFSQ